MKLFATSILAAGLALSTAAPVFAAAHEDPLVMSCTDYLAAADEDKMNMSAQYDIALETQGKSDAEVAAMKAAIEAETEDQKTARQTAAQERMTAMVLACEANPDKSVAEAEKRS